MQHFKLYKAGKQWLIAGMIISALVGLSNGITVHADSTSAEEASQITNVPVEQQPTTKVTSNIDVQTEDDQQDNQTHNSNYVVSHDGQINGYGKNGNDLHGWQMIDQHWYLFDQAGVANTNWQKINSR
ncbi:KxYKxGKxW signal peptide domain-containing protein [[Lactobacillus] timonensis]|uniref:KxYKxGKxW signal peptide domain-containing protein n=1 Tax=[Lactobacillus] timonensis TaxID=1970790 RepID=UPI000C8662BF|nr:KxYKxGKxW signal peptide domain-containing protein [[Lactobacillus] timonensis]